MKNKESRRRTDTTGRKAPSSSSRLSSVRDGAAGKGGKAAREPSWGKKKMEMFHSKNPKPKDFAAELRERKAESFCETPGLVLSSACRYLGLWACWASQAFLLLSLTARNSENTQDVTLAGVLLYLFGRVFVSSFGCFIPSGEGGQPGDKESKTNAFGSLSASHNWAISLSQKHFRAGPWLCWAVGLCRGWTKFCWFCRMNFQRKVQPENGGERFGFFWVENRMWKTLQEFSEYIYLLRDFSFPLRSRLGLIIIF